MVNRYDVDVRHITPSLSPIRLWSKCFLDHYIINDPVANNACVGTSLCGGGALLQWLIRAH